MIQIEMIARPGLIETYGPHLSAELTRLGLEAEIGEGLDPATVDYLIYAPHDGQTDLTSYTKAKAVLGLWAGVETIIANPTLTLPYARMVDEGLTEGMVDWVTAHVLRHHVGLDQDVCRTDGQWVRHLPPLARDRRVGILGMGALGSACARALRGLNFQVAGWSRSPKQIEGITCFAGDEGLSEILAISEILVLLLPATSATENILNAETLAQLPEGAVVINPGRGALIDDAALLAALDSGALAHATLDAFRVEPLPGNDLYWQHPKVTVTPHIASETRPETASKVIAENIRRGEAGEPFLHLVDRARGY